MPVTLQSDNTHNVKVVILVIKQLFLFVLI